jgi:hypothetical protein
MRTSLPLLTLLLLTLSARTSEPYKVDVTQQALAEGAEEIDHLVPVDGGIPEFYYIAQFIHSRSFVDGSYMVVLRSEAPIAAGSTPDPFRTPTPVTLAKGRYLMRTGITPLKGGLSKPPKTDTEIQIPETLARVIYEIWVNALLEVRYDRKAYGGLDGDAYTFSTFVRALGWMHGSIWSPEGESPPAWMADAGTKLLAFARDSKGDAKTMEGELIAVRDKIYRYLKTHGKH